MLAVTTGQAGDGGGGSNWTPVQKAKVDNVLYSIGDHVYMESANEAYYIGRILGFRVRNDVLDGATSSDKPSRSFVPHVQSASSTVVAKAADTRSAMTPQQLEQHDKYQVRVAWFYRAKDVPKYHWRKGKGASSLDPHLLLGTMHSDVNPLVSLRGHCTVKYILEIDNLETYRAGEDNFYFWLLYDRFTFTIFDVIRTSDVKHLPDHVLAAIAPFKYILCESGRSTDFSEVSRVCKVCTGWIGSNSVDSTTCYTCMTHFHLVCLDMEMRKRPGRGYVWNCKDCAEKLAAEEAKKQKNNALGLFPAGSPMKPTPMAGSTASNGNTDMDVDESDGMAELSKDMHIEIREPSDVVKQLAQEWPFRYLGLYFREKAMDASLYDDDLIFPYARSRLGRSYQIEVPDEGGVDLSAPSVRPRNSRIRLNEVDIPEQVLWTPLPSAVHDSEHQQDRDDDAVSDYVKLSLTKMEAALAEWQRSLASVSGASGSSTGGNSAGNSRKGKGSSRSNHSSSVNEEDLNSDLPIPPPPILRDELIDTALFALNSNAHNTAKALSLIDTALAVVYDGGGSSATNGLDNPSTLATLVADLNAKRNSINWSLDERKLFMVGIERFGRDPYQISKLIKTKGRQQVVAFFYHWKTTAEYREWKNYKRRMAELDSDEEDTGGAERPSTVEPTEGGAVASATRKRKTDNVGAKKHLLSCFHCGFRFDHNKEGGRKVGPLREHLCGDCLLYWKKYGDMRPVDDEERQRNGWIDFSLTETRSGDDSADAPKKKKKVPVKTAQQEAKLAPMCIICLDQEEDDDNHVVSCSACKMNVHEGCYGLSPTTSTGGVQSWTCAKCENERQSEYTTNYKCVLCPVVGGAMKRTIENNWVHVVCAMFHPEVRFVDPDKYEPVTCIGKIPKSRWVATCTVCNQSLGACVTCSDRSCSRGVHVTCAQQSNLVMAPSFEHGKGKQPKLMIFCARHPPDRIPMYEEPRSSLLRNFCRAFKRQGISAGFLHRTQAMTLGETCWCHMGGSLSKPPQNARPSQAHPAHPPRAPAAPSSSRFSGSHQSGQSSRQALSGNADTPAVDAHASSDEMDTSAMVTESLESLASSASAGGLSFATTAVLDDENADSVVVVGSVEEEPAPAAPVEQLVCAACGTEYTPYWWPNTLEGATGGVVCQACHWDAENSSSDSDDEENEGVDTDKHDPVDDGAMDTDDKDATDTPMVID